MQTALHTRTDYAQNCPPSACEMAIWIDNKLYACSMYQLSFGKIFATVIEGDPDDLSVGDEGMCFLSYQDDDLEKACKIVQKLEHKVVLSFSTIDIKDILFLNRVIAECIN